MFIIFADCALRGIDLVFALDVSLSIKSQRFQLIRDFVAKISQRLDIGPKNSLAGVILFGGDAVIHFDLQENRNQTDLLAAIAEIPYTRSRGTLTHAALQLLQDGARDGRLGLRDGYPHVAIVVTDGKSTDSEDLNRVAMTLCAVNIYAAGIDSGANDSKLRLIACDLSLAFSIDNFDVKAIKELEQSISDQLCSRSCEYLTVLFNHHNE